MKFVLTGRSDIEGVFIKRADLIKAANSKGHIIGNSITYNTKYLVRPKGGISAGMYKEFSSKEKKSLLYGVRCISYQDWYEFLIDSIDDIELSKRSVELRLLTKEELEEGTPLEYVSSHWSTSPVPVYIGGSIETSDYTRYTGEGGG